MEHPVCITYWIYWILLNHVLCQNINTLGSFWRIFWETHEQEQETSLTTKFYLLKVRSPCRCMSDNVTLMLVLFLTRYKIKQCITLQFTFFYQSWHQLSTSFYVHRYNIIFFAPLPAIVSCMNKRNVITPSSKTHGKRSNFFRHLIWLLSWTFCVLLLFDWISLHFAALFYIYCYFFPSFYSYFVC